MRLLVTIAIIFSSMPAMVAAAMPDIQSEADCSAALDNSRTLYNEGDKKSAYSLLTHMQDFCTSMPQIEHNLGVLATSNEQYDLAIEHFQKSLKQDPRAQHTFEQLQAVNTFRASVAYAEAIQQASQATPPAPAMQDSSYLNSKPTQLAPAPDDLRTAGTVEYELYDWWQSARDKNPAAWLSHYDPSLQPAIETMRAPVKWSKTQRSINFTAEDAVAVVSYRYKKVQRHKQLIMRLQGNRWKIYQELDLR